jgi:hypothetical protein
VTDPGITAHVRRRGFLLAVLGPIISALGFLSAFVLAELELEWIPRGLAGAMGLAMAGGVVMLYQGLWYWITGRDQKLMSPREKAAFFAGFVLFVILGVIAVVMIDGAGPAGPQGVRGYHPGS